MIKLLKGSFIILSVWAIIFYFEIANPAFLPDPLETLKNLVSYLSTQEYWKNIIHTMYRLFSGLFLGCIFGAPTGLLLGSSKKIYSYFEFIVDFFRSLPVTSLFPLFLLVFGIGDNSKIAMVTVAVYFIMLINGYYAIIQSSKQRVRMAKIFKASKYQIWKDIVLMESLPQLFVGLRISISTSLIVVIISEMFIGTEFGLGQRIYDLYSKNLTIDLYSNLIIIGIIGYVINKIQQIVEQRVLFWVGK